MGAVKPSQSLTNKRGSTDHSNGHNKAFSKQYNYLESKMSGYPGQEKQASRTPARITSGSYLNVRGTPSKAQKDYNYMPTQNE